MGNFKLTTKNRHHFAPFCPCGKSNRDGKFCPFELENGPSADHGFCHGCGETFLPGDRPRAFNPLPEQRKKEPQKFVDAETAEATFCGYGRNNLFVFLATLFDAETLEASFTAAKIGTAKDGSAVFWSVDKQGRFTGAKKIQYDPATGKRVKAVNPIHLFAANDNYEPCLFGLWQLAGQKKDVCIVESEKTAFIMSLIDSKNHWIATGGKTGLTAKKAATLAGAKVFLIPDGDTGREAYRRYEKDGYGKMLDLYPEASDGRDIADIALLELTENKKQFTDITDEIRRLYSSFLL